MLLISSNSGSQLKNSAFQKVYERIIRVAHFTVSDSNGIQRPVFVNYRKEYPVENNDWGDFQAHRRVLGLISIGREQLMLNKEISTAVFASFQFF